MPAPPRAVVFDLDGLMFNTEALYEEVGDALLRRRGHRLTRVLLDRMMGRPGRVALQLMIEHHGLDATVEQLQQETDALFPAILDRALAPMPGLLELLECLETAEVPRAVATSSRRAFVEDVLGRFQLVSRFAFLLTAEDVVQGKPHPEIYLTAARRLGCQPNECLVLEDSQNGCRAAVAAGAITVAVPGEHSRGHAFDGVRLQARGLDDPRLYSLLQLSPRPPSSPRPAPDGTSS